MLGPYATPHSVIKHHKELMMGGDAGSAHATEDAKAEGEGVKAENGAAAMDVDGGGAKAEVKAERDAKAAAESGAKTSAAVKPEGDGGAGKEPSGADKKPGEKEDKPGDEEFSDSDGEQDEEEDEGHTAEPWIAMLLEKDYDELPLEHRLAALSFLINLVVNGPTVCAWGGGQ